MDIGGFAGDATGELLTRWMEFGIFQPFCRNHSAWDTRRQEPWAFGEPSKRPIRAMLRLRQRLIRGVACAQWSSLHWCSAS